MTNGAERRDGRKLVPGGDMKELLHCRAMESMCRRRAAIDVRQRQDWLQQAEAWQHRAAQEIELHFRECNGADPDSRTGEAASHRDGPEAA
jgi:hypothetical protein